ncbi:hypothetical protein KC221_27370, partial [Mycobacterium tuberculosis]|nr:hypothetical protein [Mycobacterium tuberculosis]
TRLIYTGQEEVFREGAIVENDEIFSEGRKKPRQGGCVGEAVATSTVNMWCLRERATQFSPSPSRFEGAKSSLNTPT